MSWVHQLWFGMAELMGFWQVTLDLWLPPDDATWCGCWCDLTMVAVAITVILIWFNVINVTYSYNYHIYHESSCHACVLCLFQLALWTKKPSSGHDFQTRAAQVEGLKAELALPLGMRWPTPRAWVVVRCCAKAIWILSERVGGLATGQSRPKPTNLQVS